MKAPQLVVCVVLVTVCAGEGNTSSAGVQDITQARTAKFFPLYHPVRFRNDACLGVNFLQGTCYTHKECKRHGGLPSGNCAKGYGVCCIFLRTCGTTSRFNNTYFINPLYPLQYTGGRSRCDLTINKCNKNICQLRLDFLEFSTSQPNWDGSCQNDVFTVTGTNSPAPRICGENSAQHVYLDFPPGDAGIQMTIDTNVVLLNGRKWNIKVSQIACDSPNRAPLGCLMYLTGLTGNMMSLNYAMSVNPTVDPTSGNHGTREMANQNYGVCVRPEAGYCSLEWSQATTDGFAVSGDSPVIEPGSAGAAEQGAACTQDFVVIPNPFRDGVPVETDRFCGNALAATTTSSKPYVLTVVTDSSEHLTTPPSDIENRGFSLNYKQLPCV